MADNYGYTAGTSGTAAGDLIDNVLYPRVKITLGNDGTADGDVCSSRAMPADIISGTVTNVTNLDAGTVTEVATVTGAGTLAAVGQVHNAGTIAGLPDIPGGTVDIITNGTIAVSAIEGDIAGGTIDLISALAIGTVKDDGRTGRNVLTYGTVFGGTAAGYATLVGSASVGAGTYCWVNDISIVNTAGTLDCLVGFGTALNGTSVLVRGEFASEGGIQKSYPKPVNAGMTNQDLVAYIAAAGTASFNVSYFISA